MAEGIQDPELCEFVESIQGVIQEGFRSTKNLLQKFIEEQNEIIRSMEICHQESMLKLKNLISNSPYCSSVSNLILKQESTIESHHTSSEILERFFVEDTTSIAHQNLVVGVPIPGAQISDSLNLMNADDVISGIASTATDSMILPLIAMADSKVFHSIVEDTEVLFADGTVSSCVSKSEGISTFTSFTIPEAFAKSIYSKTVATCIYFKVQHQYYSKKAQHQSWDGISTHFWSKKPKINTLFRVILVQTRAQKSYRKLESTTQLLEDCLHKARHFFVFDPGIHVGGFRFFYSHFHFKEHLYIVIDCEKDFLTYSANTIHVLPTSPRIGFSITDAQFGLQGNINHGVTLINRNYAKIDLPVIIFESYIAGGIPQLISVRSNYAMEIIEVEIISIVHVAHLNRSDGGTVTTQLAAHPTSIHNAIKMLNKRIRIVHQHLLALQRGDVPLEYSMLRRVSNQRLPTIKSEKFQDDFMIEFNYTLLTTDLAMFINSMSTLDELIGKFNINYNCIHKVFDLSETKPSDFVQHGLACWENLLDHDECCAKPTCKNLRVMVASGDVTVCWVLGSFGELHQQNREPRPQAGIIPLSTAATGQISHLDSWHVLLHKDTAMGSHHGLLDSVCSDSEPFNAQAIQNNYTESMPSEVASEYNSEPWLGHLEQEGSFNYSSGTCIGGPFDNANLQTSQLVKSNDVCFMRSVHYHSWLKLSSADFYTSEVDSHEDPSGSFLNGDDNFRELQNSNTSLIVCPRSAEELGLDYLQGVNNVCESHLDGMKDDLEHQAPEASLVNGYSKSNAQLTSYCNMPQIGETGLALAVLKEACGCIDNSFYDNNRGGTIPDSTIQNENLYSCSRVCAHSDVAPRHDNINPVMNPMEEIDVDMNAMEEVDDLHEGNNSCLIALEELLNHAETVSKPSSPAHAECLSYDREAKLHLMNGKGTQIYISHDSVNSSMLEQFTHSSFRQDPVVNKGAFLSCKVCIQQCYFEETSSKSESSTDSSPLPSSKNPVSLNLDGSVMNISGSLVSDPKTVLRRICIRIKQNILCLLINCMRILTQNYISKHHNLEATMSWYGVIILS